MYNIEHGSYAIARKLGVTIKPSYNKHKKIDVYKDDKHIASIGATGMMDYFKFLARDGPKVASLHRQRYLMRHEKDRHIIGSNGYYAAKILWDA